MKKILIIILSFQSLLLVAQKKIVSFKIGDEYKRKWYAYDLGFLGDSSEGVVNVSLSVNNLLLTRFDPKTLKQTSEVEIPLEEATKNYNSEGLVNFGTGRNYWLHSDWDKESQQEYLYYDKINLFKGQLDEKNKLILNASKIAGSFSLGDDKTGRVKNTDKYRIVQNAAKTKLLVSYRLIPESKKDSKNFDKIGFFVFDQNMKKIWGREYYMPYNEAEMDNFQYVVDSKGEIYSLVRIRDAKAKQKDPDTMQDGVRFALLRFSVDSDQITEYPVKMRYDHIARIWLMESDALGVFIAGTSTSKTKGDYANGVLVGLLDKNANAVVNYKQGFYKFPIEELKKCESEKGQRRMDKTDDYEIKFLAANTIQVDEKGEIFFGCEVGYSNVQTSGNSRYVLNYREDIISMKIDANGDVSWLRKIPKKQVAADEIGQLSYKLLTSSDNYYIIYCDSEKNLDLKLGEEPAWMKNGKNNIVMLSTIAKDGVENKSMLFDSKEEDAKLHPSEITTLGKGRYVSRARVGNKTFRPVLITIEE
jgi:hypothetical protein